MFTRVKFYGVFIALACFILLSPFAFFVSLLAAEENPIIIKFAHQLPESQPVAKQARFFEKLVKERSNGKVIIEVYPAAQLFGARDLLPAVRKGAVDMAAPVSGSIQGAIPMIEILHLPFLYDNLDQVTKMWQGYPGEIIKSDMEKIGIKFLAEGYFGHSTISNSRREIRTPQDVRGLKIRTAGPMDGDVITILGGSPIVIGGEDAYLAMQRKTVDGSFTGTPSMASRKYWEIQKYLSIIPLTYTSIPMLINLEFWNRLPKTVQNLIEQCAKESEELVLNLTLKDSVDSVDKLKEHGVQVYYPTPSELEEFRTITAPLIKTWIKDHGEVGAKMVEYIKKLK